jgi:hypothetical protein
LQSLALTIKLKCLFNLPIKAMPISSTHLSRVNDHLTAAIEQIGQAQTIAFNLRSELHAIALSENRVTGLIDVVQWQTRISEALLTVIDIRDTPCLGASVGELVSPSGRGRDDAVDEQPIGSDFMVEPGGSVYAPEDDSFSIQDTIRRIAKAEPWQGQAILRGGAFIVSDGFAYPLDPADIQVPDQNPPDGMEA